MTPEQDSFEELRRLLALKRHEQPPPGYFNQFSRQVIARIKAGETAESKTFLERLFPGTTWLRSLWNGFEAKPVVAGAFGIGVCSLLVVGLASSERMDSSPMGLAPSPASPQPILANVQSQNGGFLQRAFADRSVTSSVYSAQSRSIFDEIRPHVQTVNFSFPSN